MATKKYETKIRETEKEMVKKFEENKASYRSEAQRTDALKETLEATEGRVAHLEARAKAADPEVTGKALVEARGDREVAQLALAGNQSRMKRLSQWLEKANIRKDVAEIVREILVARALPGANSYATFVKAAGKPEALPALVVTQLDGQVGSEGVGEGKVEIAWFRSPLHAPLTKDRLRNALEASEVRLDPRIGFDGFVDRSTREADIFEANLRGVAERVPVVGTPLDSVAGWDESLAIEAGQSQDVEAEAVGAQVASVDEDGNGIRTTVVRLSVAVKQTNHAGDINLRQIVHGTAERRREQAVSGLGRCIEVETRQVEFAEDTNAKGVRAAFVGGRSVYAVELTYVSRAA